MKLSRAIILIIMLCTTATVAVVLMMHQDPVVVNATPLAASVGEIKAAEVVRDPFDESLMKNHLALTPTNIVWFTNYYRVRNGRKPLKMIDALNRSAYKKSLDLFAYDYFDHNRENGPTFDAFIDDAGYDFIKAGENLAHGDFKTSREVVEAWMRSEEHRENILDDSYTEIGVAISHGTLNGVSTAMFVQHFGLPKKYCPGVSMVTKNAIDQTKSDLGELKQTIQAKEYEIGAAHMNSGTYNDLITTYNNLVTQYNQTVQKLEGMVAAYNTQVKKYDECVRGVAE